MNLHHLRYILLLLLCLLPLWLQAQVRVSGTHYELPSPAGVDHVYLFADLAANDAYIRYAGQGQVRWTDYNGRVVQQGQGAETLYPEDQMGYMLYVSDSLISSFFVIDYHLHRPDFSFATLTADMQCAQTLLDLNASLPPLAYVTPLGARRLIDRQATVTYTSLAWSEESGKSDSTQTTASAGVGGAWVDSTAVEIVQIKQGADEAVFSQTFAVAAPFRSTVFTLVIDPFATQLGYSPTTIESDEYAAVAVCAHPVSVTTTRGTNYENEPGRPIDETTLTGSAPLEVHFIANGNKPTALYYKWQIFKGSEMIAERYDEDQRYTFSDYGAYQVKCWVSNDMCVSDSTVFNLSVSESLLRVPNVFTPNGDGVNDEFRVVYRSLAEFHCWVYNRWGKLVFEWTDPSKGWDGNISGKPAAEGAYYYIIRARGTDADPKNTYHKVTKKRLPDIGVYQLSGHINLIRGH
ncbi:MAG: gliding motility-associated C-terminal domain-containing protein [Paludibacteraceae bacterium]|nr:gliding motility-associated C-terminal domain-containing protein [Paludibacteraceae bacterium]